MLFALLFPAWDCGRPADTEGGQTAGSAGGSSRMSTGEVIFPVTIAVAERKNLVKQVRVSGVVRARREVEVLARTDGDVVEVRKRNGDFAHAGEVIVRFDDRELRLALDRAETGLLGAQIEYKSLGSSEAVFRGDSARLQERLAEARLRLAETEEAFRQGKMSPEEYLRLKRTYETDVAYYSVHREDVMAIKSGLSQARETYQRAKMDWEASQVKAPFNGYIADCTVRQGMRMRGGEKLFKLVDASRMYVDVDVLETEVGKISPGSRAEVVANAFPGRAFSGIVAAINPVVDPQLQTVKVTIELSGTHPKTKAAPADWGRARLLAGMFATVSVETGILRDRLLVPREALLVRDQRTLVFTVEEGLAKWCYVEVGEQNEEYAEIKSGIKVGDKVITSGHYTLAHDAKVQVGSPGENRVAE